MEANHPFRFQKDLFDGTIELGSAPILPSGSDIRRQMLGIRHSYGKMTKSSKKRGRDDVETSVQEEVSEEVNTCTVDIAVFEDPDNFFEVENDDDIITASPISILNNYERKEAYSLTYLIGSIIYSGIILMLCI